MKQCLVQFVGPKGHAKGQRAENFHLQNYLLNFKNSFIHKKTYERMFAFTSACATSQNTKGHAKGQRDENFHL